MPTRRPERPLWRQTKAIIAGRKAAASKSKSAKGMSKGTVMMKSAALTSSMDEAEMAKIGTAPPGTQTLEMRYSVPKML